MNVVAPPPERPPDEERRSELVGSFGKGLQVIRVLADATRGMTLSEVAEATGTTRASARRYLMTLLELGYAEQIDKRFEVTPLVFSLVGARFDSGLTWRVAEPLMRRLAESVGESCTAGIRDRTEVVCLAHVASPRLVACRIEVGTRLPALQTALGRAILMELSPECLCDVIAKAPPVRHTATTKLGREEILAEMARVRADGYALVDQELEDGLRAIAVPVRNGRGRIFAALDVCAPASRADAGRMLSEFLGPLREAAQTLSRLNRDAA